MTRQAFPTSENIAATTIGSLARSVLSSSQTAVLIGITSRGLFLKTQDKWIVFLSFEDHRGPLTINLKGDMTPLREQTPEKVFLISPELITASEGKIHISLEQAIPWQAAAPVASANSIEGHHRRWQDLAQSAYAVKPHNGLSGLIPLLFQENASHPQAESLTQLLENFQTGDLYAFHKTLSALLGLGSGLTPSWDDFTLGLLLCLNRWKHILQPAFDLEKFNATLVENAYSRTTTISANLIECATLKQADERLIDALDYIFTGTGDKSEILNGLLSWGNSSGIDALIGIIFGVKMREYKNH